MQNQIAVIDSIKEIYLSLNKNEIQFDFDALIKIYKETTEYTLTELAPHKEKIKQLLKPSTFELMEHNFRENTHSNILKYLFSPTENDFGYLLLQKFLELKITDEYLVELINKKGYEILRELSVDVNSNKGRIDLFIIDKNNKFLIVIENKLLAKVGLKSFDETGVNNQLELYQNYIQKEFSEYKHLFILLDFKTHENVIEPYILYNYEDILKIVSEIKEDDFILKEYKKLLQNILKPISNKQQILLALNHLAVENKIVYLSDLYSLTNLINHEDR